MRWLLVLSVLVGCGSSETASAPAPSTPPAPAVAEPAAPPAMAEPPPAVAPPTTPPPSSGSTRPAPLTPASRASIRAAIAEGRRLTHAGDHAAALARFDEAVRLDPTNGRLACEAAYVAHLAGNAAVARRHLAVALAALPPDEALRERDRVPTAMCLYNAGLIYTAEQRPELARDMWERSIALRPNATVSARLAALPTDAEAPRWATLPSTATFEDVAAALRETLCGDELWVTPDEPCIVEPSIDVVSGLSEGFSAATLGVGFPSAPGGYYQQTLLAVRFGSELRVAELGNAYSPGNMGMSAELSSEASALDVIPGGSLELVVQTGVAASDTDMGSCDYYASTEKALVLCSVDGGTLRCTGLHYDETSSSGHEPCTDSFDDDGDGDFDEPIEGDEASEDAAGVRAEVSFSNGNVVFTVERLDETEAPYSGPVSAQDLLSRPGLSWPAFWTPLEGAAG